MKGKRIRYQQAGDFHFLTFSCHHRYPYLSTIAAMELFEDALERVRQRYRFVVAGYVRYRQSESSSSPVLKNEEPGPPAMSWVTQKDCNNL